jgi:hypothetical protein
MRQLVVRLESAENVAGLEERKLTARVFGARRSSDLDAGCSGHQGKGRQAQICETFDPGADPKNL